MDFLHVIFDLFIDGQHLIELTSTQAGLSIHVCIFSTFPSAHYGKHSPYEAQHYTWYLLEDTGERDETT